MVDVTPLRTSPAFARLWLSTFLTGLGIQLTIVAVGLQIYSITHDTIAVALVGGIALVPATLAGPLAGATSSAAKSRGMIALRVAPRAMVAIAPIVVHR